MKTPDKKTGPDLPPKPKGGGAAGRRQQFQLERGLAPQPPAEADGPKPGDEALCDGPKKPEPKV